MGLKNWFPREKDYQKVNISPFEDICPATRDEVIWEILEKYVNNFNHRKGEEWLVTIDDERWMKLCPHYTPEKGPHAVLIPLGIQVWHEL